MNHFLKFISFPAMFIVSVSLGLFFGIRKLFSSDEEPLNIQFMLAVNEVIKIKWLLTCLFWLLFLLFSFY